MTISTREYSLVTESIRVTVVPEAVEDESNPGAAIFAFSYTVTLDNLGEEVVQLVERHWHIFSANERIAEVRGPGVVGEQPVLKPGAKFQYTSGAVISDPIGAMEGEYIFVRKNGEKLSVAIPRFELLYPIMYH